MSSPVFDSIDGPRSGALEASLNFIVDFDAKPQVFMAAQHAKDNQRTGVFRDTPVHIADARLLDEPASLDREGFARVDHGSRMTDFYDDGAVEQIYYPEVTALLMAATGATDVHIFDHTIRVEDDAKRHATDRRSPVLVVHNDYTEKSGPQRVRDLLDPAMAARYLDHRFAMVNVWRSIGASAERRPLAVADARTLTEGNFVATDLVYEDRTGEIYQVSHDATQRWFYYSELGGDEVVLLKCFDTARDGRARYTAHTGFENPAAAAGTPPRESIEVRTLLSFAPAG